MNDLTPAQPHFVARDQLSEEELEAALKECAREPIHIPNSIQPHGLMLITLLNCDDIIQVSENADQHLGIDAKDLIGKSLIDIFGEEQINAINEVIRFEGLASYRYMTLKLRGASYDLVVHISGNKRIIELEPKRLETPTQSLNKIYELLRNYSIEVQRASDVSALFDVIVSYVREITGFDRVKLYRFDEQWNGTVVAEDKAEHMPSYKGLRFPASDIPEQARRLYAVNYLRLIPDIRYKPSPRYPTFVERDQTLLDLTHSILRSVSPVHIQYLENICVQASMSISILQDGKLWGLVACHHNDSLYLPHGVRVVSEVIAHIFSARLTSLTLDAERQRSSMRKILINRLSALSSYDGTNRLIAKHYEEAIEVLEADGLIIHSRDIRDYFGHKLDPKDVEKIVDWYKQHGDRTVVHSTDMGEFFRHYKPLAHLSGGILIAPIGNFGDDVAIWLRKAKVEQVKWAGNPEKPIEQTKAGYRLTPRSSFELWQTQVKGKCDEWTATDIETAESIAHIFLENEKIRADLANQAKTDFLSHMSHELRTPLGAIISIIQILNRDQEITAKQARLISALEISADSLLGLINDLLDIGRIEADEMTLEEDLFSLTDILEEVRSVMAVKASAKGIGLMIDYSRAGSFRFVVDKSKVKQVLFNLVANAIKFTERGSVSVIVQAENVPEDPRRKVVKIEVIDTGIGIASTKLDTIFDKFVQADASISRRFGGSGLGLSICKSLVDLMRGQISVASQVGLGTNFTVVLPLLFEQTELSLDHDKQPKPVMRPNVELKKRLRILMAEDYEGNIVAALDFLQHEGCEVVIARNGEIAVEYYKNQSFDLIIMDVQMPVMDGLTATRIIKDLQRRNMGQTVPILGMTANALREDRERCLAAGMDDYISKPMHLNELMKKIHSLTERYQD